MKNLKNLSTWIITEGIAGTENQCIGVAEALGVHPEIKRIDLKQPWKKLSPYLGWECAGSFSSPLKAPWPDLLIASGRKSIAAARYIKKKSPQTFTVYLQDPRINPAEFDLVIAPEHDRIKGANVVKTLAAPNRITKETLENASQAFPELAALPSPRVAVLIGGKSKAHRLTPSILDQFMSDLRAIEGSLMITTSRRTGEANEKHIKRSLQDLNPYIWDGKGDNPYFAMLGLADTIIVTSDSTSMLSEAATTGKPVYMVPLAGGSRRIDRMHTTLIEHGSVRIFNGILEKWVYPPLNDAQKAADAIAERLYID